MKKLDYDIPEGASLLEKAKKALINWIVENNATSGTRLPSERDFALILKVSKITVANAFSMLETEGIIARTPRRGTYVKIALKRPYLIDVYVDKDWKNPLLAFDHMHHSYFLYREFLDGIWSAGSDFNMSICFEFLDKENPLLNVKSSLFRDGAIFVNTEWPATFKNMLFEKKIPFVMMATGQTGSRNCVGIRHSGLIKGLEELFRLGHRDFGLLTHWTREDTTRTIEAWMKEKNIPINPELICSFPYLQKDEEYIPHIRKYMTRKKRPTAIVSMSPIYTRPFFGVAAEMGIKIPDDISFLHSGDNHSIEILDRNISLDRPCFFDVARESIRQLALLLKNQQSIFDEILLDTVYIPGNTFAPPTRRTP